MTNLTFYPDHLNILHISNKAVSLIVHVLTGGALLISFKNFSFVFTTWLSIWLKSPSFHLISVFKMPSSLSWIISSFWFEVILPFTWTLRSHCRVIDWPNFNIVSQYIRGLEERERDKDWLIDGAVWSHKYLFIKFAILNEYHLQALKKTRVTSKITDHRWP